MNCAGDRGRHPLVLGVTAEQAAELRAARKNLGAP